MIIKSWRYETLKKHREKKRRWAINYLGGKCSRCGTTERLEFDHIDPATKSFPIGTNIGRTKEYLIPELKKCQVLCKDCHMDKTIIQRNQLRAAHGTPGMYCNWGCRCDSCKLAWSRYQKSKNWYR